MKTQTNTPSPVQLDVLRFWHQYHDQHGYWPTGPEAAQALGKAQVTIWELVAACCKKGLLERSAANLTRNYRLTPAGLEALGKPKTRRTRWPVAGTLSDKGIAWKDGTPT